MRCSVEVSHEEWIAAPLAIVRAQFADLHHHIAAGVHPKLRFEIISLGERRARFVQEERLLGIRQRDVFERVITVDRLGMVDTAIDGPHRDGWLSFRFTPGTRSGRDATLVTVKVSMPVPRLLGMLRPLWHAHIRRKLLVAMEEDRHDIEVRGYPRSSRHAVADGLAA